MIKNEQQESPLNIILMGILSGLFVFNRPPDSLLLIPVLFSVVINHRTRVPAYLIGGFLGALPFLFYNYSVFGTMFGGYSENLSLFSISGSFIGHFLGLLISPNVGLLIFSPVLLLSLAGYYVIYTRRNSSLRTLLLVAGIAVVLEILLYSFWNTLSASGAFVFGPRYLTGLLPVLCLALGFFLDEWFGTGRARHRGTEQWIVVIIVCSLVVMSAAIQVIGVFFYNYSSDENKTMDDERAWDVTDSLIIRGFEEGSRKIPGVYVCMLPPFPSLTLYSFPQGSPGK
jgi:hypothetical protein